MTDLNRWQVPDLLLGHVEPDTAVDPSHCADRNRHLLAAPQVPLLEYHVGHMMIEGVDDKPLDASDVAIGGMDLLAAAYGHFALGEGLAENSAL